MDLTNLDRDNPTKEQVLYIFRYRCAKCKDHAVDVHEIVPRSRGKHALKLHNRVALCRKCHDGFHLIGASVENIIRMQEIRDSFLIAIGRAEYLK